MRARGQDNDRGDGGAKRGASRRRRAAASTSRHREAGPPRSSTQTRSSILHEAARIMAEEGIRDFQLAKRKACRRLAVPPSRNLPSNAEIEVELRERLRLFGPGGGGDPRRDRIALALSAIELLRPYRPQLVGAVARNTVTRYTPLELHVFATTPEEVILYLGECGVPAEPFDKRFRFGRERQQSVPALRFRADDIGVEVVIFPENGLREAPLSPVDGRPMERLSAAEVAALAAELDGTGA